MSPRAVAVVSAAVTIGCEASRSHAENYAREQRAERIRPPSRAAFALAIVVMLLAAACHPPAATRPAPERVGLPRCLAHDNDGNEVGCNAPKRSYDGDSCICADGYGRAFYGRVQEHPR